MSESLYVAEVSPLHQMTFSAEFSSSLTIKSSYTYTGLVKRQNLTVFQTFCQKFF